MIEAVIKHKHVTIVAILILCLLGITAALRIPVQMIPDLEVRTISVQTQWPGATPQDIEKEILIEQEEFLRTVPNLQRMESSASNGEASIELDFPFGVDVTETLILVNNALSQVPDYPENVDEPRIFSASFSSNAFMYFRVAPIEDNPKNINMIMMRDYIEDNVRPRMSSVAGVSQVNVSGGAQRQVRILMDKDALIQYNVSVDDVRTAISGRNRDTSAGELEQGKRRFLLRTVGRFDSLEEIENTIIRRTGDSLVRLEDVADIDFNHFELNSESWFKGQQVLSLQVQRELGSNVIDIKYAMLDEVERINEELLRPAGMEITLNSDDVRYVESSVQNVLVNLLLGALFATLVMYGLMRSGRATLIAVIGIPICTLAGFLGLLLLDRTINVISLAGIAFAIGMTLDNTIVVLESIELERRKGLNPKEAAIEGVKRVWTAVLTSTLTTVMVFLPILFIVQEAGQLYSDIAIAISASIIASMFVSVTLVPLLAAYFPAQAKTKVTDKLTNRIEVISSRLLRSKKSKLSTVGVTFVAVVAIWWFLMPPAEYLPEGEEAKTFATMSAPPGYNLQTMSSIGDEIRDIFDPALTTENTEVTRSGVTIPALKTMSLSVAPLNIRIIAETRDKSRIDELMEVITQVYERYPGMRAFAAKGSIISSNDGGTRSINVDVGGQELNEVYAAARAITELSSSAAEVADHARQAADSANTADEEAGRSAIIVRESVNNIEALTSELGKAGEKARLLQDGSDKIGNILGVIVAIAEQTNLLALNAAIEAARAGDAGRGFAVVADEVRTLATRTQHSTDEISSIVESIQGAIKDVSQIISDVERRSSSTNEEALKAEQAISQIQEAVANISSMNIQIASATDEQSRVTKDLNENITGISDLSQANQDANTRVAEVSRDLSKNSIDLSQLVSRFKTK